ncbi:MAG: type II secretion system protein GspE, partial [Chthonomonadaceae bacterium]|nr:type II secretion system protein GspE [Chthonomonadaceae bacterium]
MAMLKLRRAPLGEALISDGFITADQLELALSEQKRTDPHKRLGEILVNLRFVTEPTLLTALSRQLDVPIV